MEASVSLSVCWSPFLPGNPFVKHYGGLSRDLLQESVRKEPCAELLRRILPSNVQRKPKWFEILRFCLSGIPPGNIRIHGELPVLRSQWERRKRTLMLTEGSATKKVDREARRANREVDTDKEESQYRPRAFALSDARTNGRSGVQGTKWPS